MMIKQLLKASRQISFLNRKLVTKPSDDIHTTQTTLRLKAGRKKIEDPQDLNVKASKEILKHFDEPNCKYILSCFPEKLLKKKKNPDDLYISNEKTALTIANVLKEGLAPDKTLIEVNPGLGLLTTHLIKETPNDLLIFEPNEHFHPYINSFKTEGDIRNISIKQHELSRIWRMAFVDKIDNGNRVDDALKGIKVSDYEADSNARLFHTASSQAFILHIINSLIFKSSLMAYGRCEFFLCVPSLVFMVLASACRDSYFLYRSSSVLFQLLFEYEFICKFDRKDFLPWQRQNKELILDRYRSLDPDVMYFIRAVPRQNLHNFCLPENLTALWYFVRQNFQSRSARVIPRLENWIPGCGQSLIINEKPRKAPSLMFPEQNSSVQHIGVPCRQLSTEDYYEKLDIFTEFGDLSPTQTLTLFDQFVNLPDYKDSLFVASLENTLLKLDSHPDEKFDMQDLTIQEDEPEAVKN